MTDEEKYRILFQASLDAWRFQIDSFWIRTSSFAIFELAFAAGLWKLFEAEHYLTTSGMAFGAIILTVIWILNNSRLHEYILYYQNRLKHFEKLLNISEEDSIFLDFDKNRLPKTFPGSYHIYIQIVPVLFLIGWTWMLFWSCCQIHCVLR